MDTSRSQSYEKPADTQMQVSPPASVLGCCLAKGHGPAVHTQALQLLPETVDVALCGDARVGPGLDRILFCWQPKGVPPNGVQDVGTLLQHASEWLPSSRDLCDSNVVKQAQAAYAAHTCMRFRRAIMSVAV